MDLQTILAFLSLLFGAGSLALAFYEQWALKERRRGLVAIGLGLIAASICLFLPWRSRPSASPSVNQVREPDTAVGPRPPFAGETRGNEPNLHPAPVLHEREPVVPTPADERPYNAWLRSDGLTILYAAREWIPGGCTDGTVAVGDFSPGGWETGPEVQCRSDGWLAFDVRPLLENPRFYPDHTYCLNFRNNLGNWGQHGGRQPAPGMADIGIPAAQGKDIGFNIGFRINQVGQQYEIEFTQKGVSACQS